MGALMTRTEVCELLGVSAKSLYLWERDGLIPAPQRDRRNWRVYSQDDLAAIRNFLGADSAAKPKRGAPNEKTRRKDRISARNQLSGTIVEMRKSGLMCEVVLRLGDGQEIAAVITSASAERLGLRKGRRATAVIKATEVMMMRLLLILILGVCALSTARAETLRVFAASSVTDALTEIGNAFEERHPDLTVEFNFAGSQVLRTQIEQGAEADLFISADRTHAESLREQHLLEDVVVAARNALVVVIPARGFHASSLADLARPKSKVVIAGSSVPVGRYTTLVLQRIAESGLYGDDYRKRVEANVVSQESNVRAVLAKVVLGEADAGFVYRTDALTALDRVQVLEIPDSLNVAAEYWIGIVADAEAPERARAFLEFVVGPGGQAILDTFGFLR